MTATLKHVANQYILIVDEPIVDKILYSILLNRIGEKLTENQVFSIKSCNLKGLASIIAAENLENVKGIALSVDDTLITDKILIHDLLNEVSFEEVEVTEEENYWVVRL